MYLQETTPNTNKSYITYQQKMWRYLVCNLLKITNKTVLNKQNKERKRTITSAMTPPKPRPISSSPNGDDPTNETGKNAG